MSTASVSSLSGMLDGADVGRWIDVPVPELEFAIAGLVPDRCVSLLAGDGGSGKSILLQTAATCIAIGRPFLGRAVMQRPSAYITGEDPEAIVHARQARINKALGLTMEDLAGNLFVSSMSEANFVLFSGEETPLARKLALAMAGNGIRFVGIDSASIVFDDSEIDRRAVSAFLRSLNILARRTEAAVCLLAHTSKTNDGTSAKMASGSTAWINAARAGLLLKGTEDGAELQLLKSNYSKAGAKIDLRWSDDGVLMAADAPDTGTVANIEKGSDDRLVFDQVKARWESLLDPLSKAPSTGERYLPAYMARLGVLNQKRAAAAMVRLLDAGKIVTAPRTERRPAGLKPTEIA